MTRWNSTYDMIVRALEYRQAITAVITMHADRDQVALLLSADDWVLMESLVKVCKPFKDLTLSVSEKGGFNITKVLYH